MSKPIKGRLKNLDIQAKWEVHYWSFITKYVDKPWNWGRMLDNPNITWEFIERNLDKQWDWSQLSDRKIKIEESWIYQRRVEHIKAFQIL